MSSIDSCERQVKQLEGNRLKFLSPVQPDFLSSVCGSPWCFKWKLLWVTKKQGLYVVPQDMGTLSGQNEIQAFGWVVMINPTLDLKLSITLQIHSLSFIKTKKQLTKWTLHPTPTPALFSKICQPPLLLLGDYVLALKVFLHSSHLGGWSSSIFKATVPCPLDTTSHLCMMVPHGDGGQVTSSGDGGQMIF